MVAMKIKSIGIRDVAINDFSGLKQRLQHWGIATPRSVELSAHTKSIIDNKSIDSSGRRPVRTGAMSAFPRISQNLFSAFRASRGLRKDFEKFLETHT